MIRRFLREGSQFITRKAVKKINLPYIIKRLERCSDAHDNCNNCPELKECVDAYDERVGYGVQELREKMNETTLPFMVTQVGAVASPSLQRQLADKIL